MFSGSLAANSSRSTTEIASSTVNAASTMTAAVMPSALWPPKRAARTIAAISQMRPRIAVTCSTARARVVCAAQARRLIASEANRVRIQPPAPTA